jgi:hypothetical protein
MIKGALLGAAASQSNDDHNRYASKSYAKKRQSLYTRFCLPVGGRNRAGWQGSVLRHSGEKTSLWIKPGHEKKEENACRYRVVVVETRQKRNERSGFSLICRLHETYTA